MFGIGVRTVQAFRASSFSFRDASWDSGIWLWGSLTSRGTLAYPGIMQDSTGNPEILLRIRQGVFFQTQMRF